MSKIFEDNSLTIGHTPLVRLNRIGNGRILAKVESRNPSFSVKCRIGANMIWDAEKRGVLKPGVELVEPTSGNTGIALAYVAAARGYKLTLTMPETMSIERRKLLKALGANTVLTEGAKGMKGAIQKQKKLSPAIQRNTCCCNNSAIRQTLKFTKKPPVRRSGKIPTVRLMYLLLALGLAVR